jgi:hypothetical protein
MNTALSRLSDELLLNRIDTLAARERRITLAIVDHLGEVERRELHLKLGYGSMFSYCTGRLRYSASAASRRIRTARCVRRFPRVRELLERNRVNLSTVSIVAGILTRENQAGILERIAGRSQDDVRAIAAAYKPRGAVRDSVTPVCIRGGATTTTTRANNPTLACDYNRSGRERRQAMVGSAGSGEIPGSDRTEARRASSGQMRVRRSGTGDETRSPVPAAASAMGTARETRGGNSDAGEEAAETRQQVIVRFAAEPELMQKIQVARSLLSFRLPANASLGDVLAAVLDEFIDRNDPSRRRARRTQCRNTRARHETAQKPERAEVRKHGKARGEPGKASNPRAIPAVVRDDVLVQAGGRCQYVAGSGRRCDATRHLQVDHIVPVARGQT